MATVTASSASELTNDGPVLNLINKRLRALKKKLNRITQMEEALAQGKTLNKEQEETFRSKSSVLAAIDELEKLRQPLSQAVDQEIELAVEKSKQNVESLGAESEREEKSVESEGKGENENGDVSGVSDLLKLLYFGSVFDVKTLMRAHDNMLTRTHERNCCLTYDYVTDDDEAGDPLKEWDLDMIAMLGGSLISRPVNSSFSHKNALEQCVEHAKLWLANAEQPIEPQSNITYAGLREKLNKIMASDYFTTTPEMKAPVDVAAAAGNYTSFQVPVDESLSFPGSVTVSVEGSAADYQQEDEHSPDSHNNEIFHDENTPIGELHQGVLEPETPSDIHDQKHLGQPDTEIDQNSRDVDLKEQHHSRRPYQNYRGGRGGPGGRRGYSNGRGGRGGIRGGYQNGRGQFYDQPGGYYPRTNYRGRGGRGNSGNYNYNASAGQDGHAQEAS